MTKTKTVSRKAIRFTVATYQNRLAAFVAAGIGIDRTVAEAAKAINSWAQMAAAGISTGALTLEGVKDGIILATPKAKTIAECGGAVKTRWYYFQRVVNAGLGDRLIAGEALGAVASDAKPVQAQKVGKRATAKADKKKAIPSLNDCLAGLAHYMDTAMTSTDNAKELASNAKLVDLLGKFAALDKAANGATGIKRRRGTIAALAKGRDAMPPVNARGDKSKAGTVHKMPVKRRRAKAVTAVVPARRRKAA